MAAPGLSQFPCQDGSYIPGALTGLIRYSTIPFTFSKPEGCLPWFSIYTSSRLSSKELRPGVSCSCYNKDPLGLLLHLQTSHLIRSQASSCCRRELPCIPARKALPTHTSSGTCLPGLWRLPTAVLTEVRL